VTNVHLLHPPSPSIGCFTRLGHSGHRKLATLHAAGRLPIERAVVDAAHLVDQQELLQELRASGVELILDTRAAELAEVGGYASAARHLPWAHANRRHAPSDFNKESISDFAKRIADFATAKQMHAVLAPTRLIEGPRDPWFSVDLRTCEALRKALDGLGAEGVAIDYSLLAASETIRDEAKRTALAQELRNLPFENLWLRMPGFGRNATAVALRKYINVARSFHALGRPVVADNVGGFVGIAISVFHAVSGFSHGIAEKETCDVYRWKKLSSARTGGSTAHIYIPEIDLYVSLAQLNSLFDAKGAKSLIACNDPNCCPNGILDMQERAKSHFLNQRARQLMELNGVPHPRRPPHFLRQLAAAGATARKVERLNLADSRLLEKLNKHSRRLDEMHEVLEDLHETIGDVSRGRTLRNRTTGGRTAARGTP
jgi:hypothetical protein